MAAPKTEIEILAEGMSLRDPVNNQTYIQNLYKNRGLWESREGMGTLMEFSGPLAGRIVANTTTNKFGLDKHLGSYLVKTDFGNEQIISVFFAKGWSGYLPENGTDYVDHYVVSIYDIDTNNYWQEVLYNHTSQETEENQTSDYYHGYYEARGDLLNFNQVIFAKPLEFFFTEYLGKVYFGSEEAGVFTYNPAMFIKNRKQLINNVNNKNEVIDTLTNPYSESSLITPVSFKDGEEAAYYSYVQEGELGAVVSMTANEGRLIYASGKSIYFSDIGISNAIIGDNTFTFHELKSDITAILAFNELVIVWSNSQTFVYQPSRGTLATSGRATEVHNEIGCIGPNAVLFRENKIIWADSNGIYSTGTGFSAEELSISIKKFFTDSTVNPFIHYFTEAGFVGTSQDLPDFVYRAEGNLEGAHLAYDQKYEQLFFTIPKLNITWVFKDGWYLWSYTSIVNSTSGPVDHVAGSATVSDPWMVCSQNRTFMIGGKQEESLLYTSATGPIVENQTGTQSSFRLFEWGRGGALDGSTNDFDEGARTAGFYDQQFNGGPTFDLTIYYDPIEKWGNLLSFDATQSTVYEETDELVYLPIYFTPTDGTNRVTKFELEFTYDTSRYAPVAWTGGLGGEMVFMLPPERAGLYNGFSPGAIVPTAGVWEDPVTRVIKIYFNESLCGATENSYAWMHLNPLNKNPIIWIPLKKIGRSTVASVSNSNVVISSSMTYTYLNEEGAPTETTTWNSYRWNPGWYALENTSTRTNGVDWVYKSGQIGIEDQNQIKARGSYSLVSSRGKGTPIKDWSWGIWNSVAGSDYKDYVTQTVDVEGTNNTRAALVNIADKNSIRTRFRPSTVMEDRLMGANATYGDNTDANIGNYLVDVEEVDTIATSDSVRGESVNYTFFGFLLDKASKISISSIKIALQAVAGRRRRGR